MNNDGQTAIRSNMTSHDGDGAIDDVLGNTTTKSSFADWEII